MQKVDPPDNQYMKVNEITRSSEPPPISQAMERLMSHSIMKKIYIKKQLIMLQEEMKTSFKDFTIFNSFVNRKLDRNKNDCALQVKIFALEDENECL